MLCLVAIAAAASGCGGSAVEPATREAVQRDLATLHSLRISDRKQISVSAIRDQADRTACARVDSMPFGNPKAPDGDRQRIVVNNQARTYALPRGALLAGLGLVIAAASSGLEIERTKSVEDATAATGNYMLRVTVSTPHGGHVLRGALLGGEDLVPPDRRTISAQEMFPFDPSPRVPTRLPARKMGNLTFRF